MNWWVVASVRNILTRKLFRQFVDVAYMASHLACKTRIAVFDNYKRIIS